MKLETFFGKFDLFADAPDAVTKLRELVLELAVRGQLSERLPRDRDDPAWRAFIKEFDSRIYAGDPGRPPPYDVPDEWRWVTMTDAADCRAAAKVDAASLKDPDWVLDLEDIEGGAGKVIVTATFAERRSLSTKATFQKDDVLYGKLRPYLNKVVVADRPGFCTTEIVPLRPKPFVSAGYLRLFLRSPTFLRYAAQKNYGMKMPRLGTKDLESAGISFPPLAEQKRIVAKVDELMALCDRLEAQQQERQARERGIARASLTRFAAAPTPENLNLIFHPSYSISPADLRKAILTVAVQGKLVPQDPNDEPAEVLLRRIGEEKRILLAEKLLKKSQTPENSIDSTDGLSLPIAWKWAKADDLFFITKLAGFEYTDHMRLTDKGEVPVIRAQNVKPEGILKTHLKFIDSKTSKELSRSALTKPALLVTFIGAGIGDVALFDESDRWHLAPNVAKMEPFNERGEKLSLRYLLLFMQSPFGRSEIFKHLKSTAQPSISMATIRDIDVSVPPLPEQHRIVAKVEQLMALVDALETQLAAGRATAEKLLAALVAELTGTKSKGKVSKPTASGPGRRGRPGKS